MIIGNLASANRARVASGGVVTVADLAIAWWVGADDRWHIPAQEIATRQSLVGDAPIVRTSVRVPSGDAVMTAYAVRQGRHDLVAIDIENRSRAPFAIAMVFSGPGARQVTVEARVVAAAGRPILFLPRSASFVASVAVGGDLLGLLQTRGATAVDGTFAAGVDADAIAVLFPVSHATSLRFAAPLGDDPVIGDGVRPVLSALAGAETVGKGWDVQVRSGVRIMLPDDGLVSATNAAMRSLLLALDAPPDDLRNRLMVATAAGWSGFGPDASRLLDGLAQHQGRRGALDDDVVISALGVEACIACDASELVTVVCGALEFVAKKAKDPQWRPWAAILALAAPWLDRVDEHGAAAAARRVWTSAGRPWPLPRPPLPPLPALSDGGALVPDHPARVADQLNRGLAAAFSRDADGSISLFPSVPHEWRGQPLEVANVPVGGASLSAVVRWHGARPALLWELDGPMPHGFTIRCPDLDGGWSTTQPSGEALLYGGMVS